MTARRLAVLVASAVAPTLLAAEAPAQTLPLSLKWTAPASCPTGEDVLREVARQAHVVPGGAPAKLDADARVEPIGERWRVELRTSRAGVEGYQTLVDDSCELLARATALVLALSLYEAGDVAPPAPPEADVPRTEPTPAPRRRPPAAPPPASEVSPLDADRSEPQAPPATPPRPSEPASSPPLSVAVAPAAPPPRSRSWALAAEARAQRGPLPATTLGFGVGLDVGGGRWLLRSRFQGTPASERASAAAPDIRASYQAWGASLAPCAVVRPLRRLLLAGCVELDASVLAAAAVGAPVDESAFAPWYAAGPTAFMRVRVLGRAHLEVGGGLGVSIDRPRFALRHLGDVYEVPRVVSSATLGLSIDI
jgi:hypothetical protein